MAAHDNDDARHPLLPRNPKTCQNVNEKVSRKCGRRGSAPAEVFGFGPDQEQSESVFSSSQELIRFKEVFLWLVAYLGAGTLCFFLIKDQIEGHKTNRILDAVYFCVVTMTTVGYGDLVPSSTLAKLCACAYVFTGMALVGLILSKAADYLVEKQQLVLVNAIYKYENAAASDSAQLLKEVIETRRIKYKLLTTTIILIVLVITGTAFLCVVENLKFMDALYCVCSTITTLGYGDKSFSTGWGRFFAVFWILSGTLCLAQFLLYLTELYTQRRHASFVKRVLTRKLTFSDLEAADLDNDKAVSSAEFVIYKLKEMGKISQEDISLLMERFRNLDADRSGTLTAADIGLS